MLLDRRTLNPAPALRGDFILCACQGGAEEALCARQAELLPAFSRGAWRRSAVTFRIGPPGADPADEFFPDLVFNRTVFRSLGQVAGADPLACAALVGERAAGTAWDNVHVWTRDPRTAVDVASIRKAVVAACGLLAVPDPIARPGDLVIDCVLDSAERWWVGWHRASSPPSTWPGGMYPGGIEADKVSRAWLKLDEALATFDVPLKAGERAIELGAAPGGACQRLLEAGLEVVGVDAAVVDDRVAAHPRFTQWRMRARDVQLRRFKDCQWLLTDMNIDPTSTMEALGRVVATGAAKPKGIIATLKLPEWSRAADLPGWLAMFRSWGYEPAARQLSTGGREICVVAMRAGRGGPVTRRPATRRRGA
jgi:23S rRNA (cytidine2498-2'-O)-methyltransferase